MKINNFTPPSSFRYKKGPDLNLLSGSPLCAPSGNLSLKTTVLLELITK